jgi:hypothetical protein
MPWNLKDFTVLFFLGSAILITGLIVILYFNSNIESLRIQLQGTSLTSAQRAMLQGSLNSLQLNKISLIEPFSYIVMVIGSIIMLFSVIYSFLAIYRQKLELLKQETAERTPINEKQNLEAPNLEAIQDSGSNLLIDDLQRSQSKMKPVEDEKAIVQLKEPDITQTKTQAFADQSEKRETVQETELLSGKLAGLLNHPQVVLTATHLIVGDRIINLRDIREAYAEQEKSQSLLVLQFTDGTTERLVISPENSVSVPTFLSGSLDAQESEMRAGSKTTTDRWVNAINQQLKLKTENQTKKFEERIKEIEEMLKKKEKK